MLSACLLKHFECTQWCKVFVILGFYCIRPLTLWNVPSLLDSIQLVFFLRIILSSHEYLSTGSVQVNLNEHSNIHDAMQFTFKLVLCAIATRIQMQTLSALNLRSEAITFNISSLISRQLLLSATMVSQADDDANSAAECQGSWANTTLCLQREWLLCSLDGARFWLVEIVILSVGDFDFASATRLLYTSK